MTAPRPYTGMGGESGGVIGMMEAPESLESATALPMAGTGNHHFSPIILGCSKSGRNHKKTVP